MSYDWLFYKDRLILTRAEPEGGLLAQECTQSTRCQQDKSQDARHEERTDQPDASNFLIDILIYLKSTKES